MEIHYFPQNLVFQEASEFLIKLLKANSDKKVLLILSGGSAVNIYKVMICELQVMSTQNIAIAQVDERYFGEITNPKSQVPNKFQNSPPKADQPRAEKLKVQSQEENINSYQIEKSGLLKVCREKNIPYFIISQDGSLRESAGQYNRTIEKLFQVYTYKIAILGIGEDGHTAGLLPGYQKLWDVNKLIVGYKNDGEFKQRISMTPTAFKQVDQAIVVASGVKKERVIKNILDENYKPSMDDFPASIIKSIPKVDLFYDKIIV